jgi:hypothetical protein
MKRFWQKVVAPDLEVGTGKIENEALAAPKSYFVVCLHCARQLTSSVSDLFAFQMPFAATLVEVSATARASGGTSPTLAIDVKENGTSVLSAAMDITAGVVTVGTIADAEVADDAKITIDATIGGTSPTWDDITVLLTFKVAHTS